MIARYLKSSVFDFLLCVAVACSIARTIPEGFYVAEYLSANMPLLIGVCAGVTAWLFVGAYSRRLTVIVIVLSVIGVGAVMLAARSSGADIFSDAETNPYLYFAILILAAAGTFLLSRTKAGCIVLFAAGTLLLCTIRFLYEKNHLVEFVVFLVCAATLYALRSYRRNMSDAKTAQPRFGVMATTAALVFVLTAALGTAAFYGVVKPLDPPARELKLITHYMSLETLERLGIADKIPQLDENMTSDKTNDDKKNAKPGTDKKENTLGGVKDDQKDDKDKNDPSALDSSNNPLFRVIRYLSDNNLWFLIPVIIAAALAVAILIKKIRRRRWLAALSGKPEREQILIMYRWYMKKLQIMKIRRAPDATLYQFAADASPALKRFAAPAADFGELTRIYVKSCYGEEPASGEEVEKYRSFHQVFYKNCLGYLGRFSYMVRFFGL
jgi:hypothetical protein